VQSSSRCSEEEKQEKERRHSSQKQKQDRRAIRFYGRDRTRVIVLAFVLVILLFL
jgi:hypothetical protein